MWPWLNAVIAGEAGPRFAPGGSLWRVEPAARSLKGLFKSGDQRLKIAIAGVNFDNCSAALRASGKSRASCAKFIKADSVSRSPV